MSWSKGLKVLRFFVGFLLAPVVVAVSLSTSLDGELSRLGARPDGPAKVMLGAFFGVVGLGVPYLGALLFGLPYTLVMLDQGRLSFRVVVVPTLIFSAVYPVIVYLSLCDMRFSHRSAWAVAAPQVFAVVVSGLSFYLLAVWKSGVNRS